MDLTFDLLANHLGETVALEAEGGVEVALVLAAAHPAGEGRIGGSLTLTGPVDQPLGQGTFPLRSDSLGEGLLFIVPVAQDERSRTYESVFG
ncbi:DUF6916 family protein [Nocardioides pacificus]